MAASCGMAFSVRAPVPAPAARPGGARAARVRAAAGSDGAKWWAPMLGWSGQPDYIDAQPAPSPAPAAEEEPQPQQGRRRFGVLTEDKARQLRIRMMESENYHDAMYHSAIASRLASATPGTKQ